VAEADLDGRTPVATFIGPDGERLALLRTTDAGLREATLEEIVLGYLASERRSVSAPAVAA
jgi:hypothetical protein